ncbi:MAG: DUF2155 domain-containing protein [Qipengyuania vulgaris]
MLRAALLILPVAMLAACSDDPPEPAPVETEIPEELQGVELPEVIAEDAGIGTPMEERVATIGLLNKRNNLSQDIELKPGEQRRVGDVVIRLRACERTAPWEFEKDEGAFVQVFVRGRGENSDFGRVFSGWLFKNKPSINVVEHPIYDVWVKSCAMEFPGEE